jgi:hypothetical protein
MTTKDLVLKIIQEYMFEPLDNMTLDNLQLDILSILPQGWSVQMQPINEKLSIVIYNENDHKDFSVLADGSTELKVY